MNDLSKKDMIKYFHEINERFLKNNIQGEILLTGGAALALVYNVRQSTMDIDAIYQPKEYMANIIKSIAKKYDINEDWLNDGVKGFVTPTMKQEEYLVLSNLKY